MVRKLYKFLLVTVVVVTVVFVHLGTIREFFSQEDISSDLVKKTIRAAVDLYKLDQNPSKH